MLEVEYLSEELCKNVAGAKKKNCSACQELQVTWGLESTIQGYEIQEERGRGG